MAVADRNGLPVAESVESATPHEVKLVESTLVQMVIPEAPQNLIGDNAYDSDKLDARLRRYGIEHRRLKRPPPEVEQRAADFLAPFNREPNTDATRSIRAFVDGFYLPHIKQTLRLSTHRTYENIWKFHLEPRIGDVRLRDFTTYDGEQLLQTIAHQNNIAKATLKQIKSVISAVFKQAKRMKFVADNPMRDTSIPNAKAHGRQTGIYSLAEIKQILTVLTGTEPARTIVAVAAFAGLRRGEIRGLEWQHYKGNALDIQQSVYLGELDAPKSEASRALVPVIGPLKKILEEHHTRSGSPATGFMFPVRNGNSKCLNTVLYHDILPVLKKADIPWRGWHAFRRGLATNLHDLGVDDITIQHILRHSDVSITRNSYIKTLPEQTVDAMQQFEQKWDKVTTNLIQ